jgi:hypothetical protein
MSFRSILNCLYGLLAEMLLIFSKINLYQYCQIVDMKIGVKTQISKENRGTNAWTKLSFYPNINTVRGTLQSRGKVSLRFEIAGWPRSAGIISRLKNTVG